MFKSVIAVLVFITSVVDARYECSNSTVVNTNIPKTDYVFLVDKSGSMGSSIAGVMSGLSAFADKVKNSNQDYSFAYVVFGGSPVIRVPFTTNIELLKSAMTADAQNPNGGGQEAAFEVMRMVLRNDAALLKSCGASISSAACTINFRTGATKVFMLVTDEDSDMPIFSANREVGQGTAGNSFCNEYYSKTSTACLKNTQYEPGFTNVKLDFIPQQSNGQWVLGTTSRNYFRTSNDFALSTPYETELQKTADLLLSQGVIVNMLVSVKTGTSAFDGTAKLPISSFGPSSNYFKYLKQTNPNLVEDQVTVARYQFGDPSLQVQSSDFKVYSADDTLSALQAAGLSNSLQGRMLSGSGFMRIFDIAEFANGVNQQLINAFYEQMIQTTVSVSQNCVFYPDPVPVQTTTVAFTSSKIVLATTSIKPATTTVPVVVPATTTVPAIVPLSTIATESTESATATESTESATATESTESATESATATESTSSTESATATEDVSEPTSTAEPTSDPDQPDSDYPDVPVVPDETSEFDQYEGDSSAPEVVQEPVQAPAPATYYGEFDPAPVPEETSEVVPLPADPVEPAAPEPEKQQESTKPTDTSNMTPVAVAVPFAAVGAATVLFMFYRKRQQSLKTVSLEENAFENSLANNPLYNQLGVTRDNPLFQNVPNMSQSRNDFAV